MVEDYFRWLYGLTEEHQPRRYVGRQHWSLCQQLHTKPFRWFVANDDNRNEDGKCLRDDWQDEFEVLYGGEDIFWPEEASVFEVLLGLSRRLSFEADGTTSQWFWKLIENLGLYKYSDNVFDQSVADDVNDVLEKFLNRQYGRDGVGGIFPLRRPHRDQRSVELWYQMSSYLLEGNDIANGP